jgi:hypothetical protein
MAKVKQGQRQKQLTWTRGQELPETLTVEEFAIGVGLPNSEDMAKLLANAKVTPLYARKPGQTKGWPSVTVLTQSQMQALLHEYEKNNQPPPPTFEQQVVVTLSDIDLSMMRNVETLSRLEGQINGIRNQLDEINEKVKQVLVQEAALDAAHPLAAMTDHANEVPSNIAQAPEGARLVRRHRTQ